MTKQQTDFNPIEYFKSLASCNSLCTDNGFKAVTISSPDNIEGVINEFRSTANFIAIEDTTDNCVHYAKPGFFTTKVYTVWILAGYEFNDPDDRNAKLDLCRAVFRQFLSRMVADKSGGAYGLGMYYLAIDRVFYKEMGRYSMNGTTGLYFMVNNDVPTDLTYNPAQWQS